MGSRPLTILTLLSHEGRGGADRLALDLSVGLRRRGHRLIWAAPRFCFLNGEARDAGMESFDPYPSGSIDMSGLPAILSFCGKERVDIINAHHSHGRHMLVRARIKGLSSKTVVTRHCILSAMPLVGSLHYNFLVDMNIAVSNAVRKSLILSGILPSKAVRIYGGIDTAKFSGVSAKAVEEAARGLRREGAFTVGMVGRLQHGRRFRPDGPTLKGHEVLFRAVAGLEGDIQILLCGPWEREDQDKLLRIAAFCGLSPEVISFCGFQEDIAPFYRLMDVHVLPSPREGLGLSLIEGMAAGTPCIGADGGGIREIITHGTDGLLFKPGDSTDLARQLRHLRDDTDVRQRLGIRGAEAAQTKFDIRRTVQETEALFCGIAGGNNI